MAEATDHGLAYIYSSPPPHYSLSDINLSLGSLYDYTSMSASSSPQNPEGSGSQEKSPLSSMNLNFLKALNDKKATRDGNPPKRRGPKPDSKPALTRRQELNRQAQRYSIYGLSTQSFQDQVLTYYGRTHRERKELYIKALEDEVLRLKEVYSNVAQDKDKLVEENRQLKGLLQQNSIPPAVSTAGVLDDLSSNPSFGYASSSVSGAHAPGSNHAFTPPMSTISSAPSLPNPPAHLTAGGAQLQAATTQHIAPAPVDYEQAGIDFVLTYDDPDDPSKAYMSPPHF